VTRVLGRFLGPKNLLPSTKRGTVIAGGSELVAAVKDNKGSVAFKVSPQGKADASESWQRALELNLVFTHILTAICPLPSSSHSGCSRMPLFSPLLPSLATLALTPSRPLQPQWPASDLINNAAEFLEGVRLAGGNTGTLEVGTVKRASSRFLFFPCEI
jgi:hypothetical protein